MSSSPTTAKQADSSPEPPAYIVLDTNVLLRLLILDFGTREAIGIPTFAQKANSLIVLAPNQEDEFWRNASEVLNEHTRHWTQIARNSRKLGGELVESLKASDALGILGEPQRRVLHAVQTAKQHLDAIKERDIKWSDFETFAEKNFGLLRKMTDKVAYDPVLVRNRAEERVSISNPPCREKKSRPLGDCMVWEVVLTLLERKQGSCWFATTDSDFSDPGDPHTLNRLLAREVRKSGGEFEFFHEDRTLGLSPGARFKVLSKLAEAIPDRLAKQMRRYLESLISISPVDSWVDVDDLFQQLSYREREILKLRLGIGDGYYYTQAEVARIFKLTQSRISQIEKTAEEKLREIRARSSKK